MIPIEKSISLPLIALKSVMDYSYSGILVIDRNHRIIYINKWACEFLDLPMKECLNKLTTDYFPNSALVKAMEKGEFHKNRIGIRNNKTVVITRIPIYEHNKIIGAAALFQDVLHLQENEMEIRSMLANKGLLAKYNFSDIIYKSKIIADTINIAKTYAKTASTILISGESGTGKELFAQSIHNYSNRCNAPFVAINCATLPEAILESELFGYTEASFTGAKKGGKTGLFQQAHMGTIFLDEIAEIPPSVQAKLLRVLQERQIRPVGSDKVIPIDVRIISATNKDLFAEVRAGRFRLDLLYRINVLLLNIPPLRERREDIIEFANNYFTSRCPSLYKHNSSLINEVLKKLSNHDFLGNIRELENILERLSLILQNDDIYKDSASIMNNLIDVGLYQDDVSSQSNISTVIGNKEKQGLIDVLIRVNGSRAEACKELGISPATLWRKMKKHNIS